MNSSGSPAIRFHVVTTFLCGCNTSGAGVAVGGTSVAVGSIVGSGVAVGGT